MSDQYKIGDKCIIKLRIGVSMLVEAEIIDIINPMTSPIYHLKNKYGTFIRKLQELRPCTSETVSEAP